MYMWGVHGLCSCKVEAPKSPSYRCVQTWVHKCLPVVKAEMGKMPLKTGIKLPWKMRGNVLDRAWSACCSTGVGEGWRQQWWVEEKIFREELYIGCETWKENPDLDIEMVDGGKWIPPLLLTVLTFTTFSLFTLWVKPGICSPIKRVKLWQSEIVCYHLPFPLVLHPQVF